MSFRSVRRIKNSWLYAGVTAWGVLLVSCTVGNRTLLAPPAVPGATLVGSAACAKCHPEVTRGFHDATHANLVLQAEDGTARNASCESCHGPASLHVRAGTRATTINPKRKPDTCLQCHTSTRAEFNLPHAHPVLGGKMACSACHDPHAGESNPAGAGARALVATANATCASCHPQQGGPFVFVHEVMREGCVSCHSPHGSVNDKLLRSRGVSLCYQCHFQPQASSVAITHGGVDHSNNVIRGACWSAGCHEAIHGSNVNSTLRY